jgi:hypothetical protein
MQMNRHERRKARKTKETEDLGELCLTALASGPYDHSIVILGVDDIGWQIWPRRPPPPEVPLFLAKHHDRLRALMDKPVLLNVFWNYGDRDATVSIIPADDPAKTDLNEPFKTFRLPFPLEGA